MLDRDARVRLIGEEICLPYKLKAKAEVPNFERYSDDDNLFFFGLENLLHTESNGGDVESGKKLKEFCLEGAGIWFYRARFVEALKILDEEDWTDVFTTYISEPI